MAKRLSLKIEGGDAIVAQLSELSQHVAGQALREAALAGAEVLRKSAADKAPRGTGNHKGGHLADGIVAEVSSEWEAERVTVAVGPDSDHYYGVFVEQGHAIVRDKKVVGNVPPHPFLRPALDESAADAEQEVAKELKKRLKL